MITTNKHQTPEYCIEDNDHKYFRWIDRRYQVDDSTALNISEYSCEKEIRVNIRK